MSAWRWMAVLGLGGAVGYLVFAALRGLADILFAPIGVRGPTWPWALLDFAAQFALGFLIPWVGPLAAPAAKRPDVSARLSAVVGFLALVSIVLVLLFGSSLGRLIPVMASVCTLLGSALGAYLWSARA